MNMKLKARIVEKFGWQVDFAQAIGRHRAQPLAGKPVRKLQEEA